MKWLFGLCVAALLTFSACGPKALDIQTKVANDVAIAANAIAPVLIATEGAEGDRAIDAAADKAAAKAAVAAVEAKWAPIWTAYKAVAIAQDAWATALEKGGDTASAALGVQSAFCKLKTLLPPEVKIPAPVTIIVCQEVSRGK